MSEPTPAELTRMHEHMSYIEIARVTGLVSSEAVRQRIKRHKQHVPKFKIEASPYPRYNKPLEMEGDALLLFDTEFPFHEEEFLNRCLDLSQAWDIDQLIIGGDVLHFDQFSQWEANWIEKQPANGLTEDKERELRAFAEYLPDDKQAAYLAHLDEITQTKQEQTELGAAKKALLTLAQVFARIDYVIGNHDDRFIRALKSPLLPQSLLDFIGLTDPTWRIAPYFYSTLISEGEKYRIDHPRSAAAATAVKLADKFDCHSIVGHSHLQSVQWSTSGKHWAIQAGCSVDEERLCYAAQRSTNRPAHSLGAVIVRGGYPWILYPRSPWDRLKRL